MPPETLAGSDIFIEIYIASNAAKFIDLQAHCHDLLVKIERLINCRPDCIIDEAQIPLRSLHGWFRSSEDQPAPVLRHIIKTWTMADQPRSLRIIVSGTGVSMRALEKVRTSTVAKEGGTKPRTILDPGAFDVEERQMVYLRDYVPEGFLNTAAGKELAYRVSFWLHGRCVCSPS